MPQFIATCAKGLEYLLVDELKDLGATEPKEGLSQVSFEADWLLAYQIIMWSRVASRVYYPIASFEAINDQVLYDQVSILDWSQHLDPNKTFLVNSQSFRSNMSHTQFISQRIKDAIVDYFNEAENIRPEVSFEEPDVVIHCRIRHNKVTLSIDLIGFGMHRRGYRLKAGAAPIKENLAAALLIRSGFYKKRHEIDCLFDPMCGSGTFLIEAAMMHFDIAPGLIRDELSVFAWQQFKPDLWEKVLSDAKQRKEQALVNSSNELNNIQFIGNDINPRVVRSAQMNLALAGLEEHIKIHIGGLDQVIQFELPEISSAERGLVITNPPYSERMGEKAVIKKLYQDLGELLKNHFQGWLASILSPDKEFGHGLGIRANKIYKFNNGSLACELLNLKLEKQNFIETIALDQVEENYKDKLSPQAIQLNNRIEKNRGKLKRFLNKESVSCYRIYDADLPDYNAAIDVYHDSSNGQTRLHIQEYKAPKSIDPQSAKRRLKEIERVAAGIYQIPRNQIFTKQRQQQKGDWQYQAAESVEKDHYFSVNENERQFWVNLQDYLDTGLFLDHRKVRAFIAEKAAGKRLLNLFCYTASISVYAATAGAVSSCNLDMSRTYLDWAKRNFSLNQIDLNQHEFIREDCFQWFEKAQAEKRQFDLIFLDPPTFSNSKKMDKDLDIQKDHPWLIEQCLKLLTKDGELIFSNNFQKFKMEFSSDDNVSVKEISSLTQSPDFNRHNLHRCWLIVKK